MINRRLSLPILAAAGLLLGFGWRVAAAQVPPAEMTGARLKALEETYFPKLLALRKEISQTRFPFELFVSRYVGLNPGRQAGADSRGLEFVLFRDRTVLKVSGNYNAAYNATLTRNQRANRVFDDVVTPILRLISGSFPADAGFDRFGFEIAYHVRTHASSYDYEGKEILVVVIDKAEALAYVSARNDPERQEILNASEIYLNGQELALALGSAQPLGAEELAASRRGREALSAGNGNPPAPGAATAPVTPVAVIRAPDRLPAPVEGSAKPVGQPVAIPASPAGPPAIAPGTAAKGAAPNKADLEALQSRFQTQLDALGKEGVARYHFVEYAPPSFVPFRNRIYLQVTLRNPSLFDRNATSIYKRAAQSFDLFLAPLLKSLLDQTPVADEIAGLDITVLTELSASSASSSEALEFVLPLQPLRQFTDADITNQDLINQSVVLANGIRIALDLQRVE